MEGRGTANYILDKGFPVPPLFLLVKRGEKGG